MTKEVRDLGESLHEEGLSVEEVVIELVGKWIDILQLGSWQIALDFGWTHEIIPCSISAEWAYLHAHLRVNTKVVERFPVDEIEELIVHELTHILLAEMRTDEDEDLHEERTATIISRAFISLQRKLESYEQRYSEEIEQVPEKVGRKAK